METQVGTARKTKSVPRVNSRSSTSHITKQSPKSLPSRESCCEMDQWSTSKHAGGRCDEPSGSEHLSRCVIPLDKSFHHHLRRAFRGAERGSKLAWPKAHSIKCRGGRGKLKNIYISKFIVAPQLCISSPFEANSGKIIIIFSFEN